MKTRALIVCSGVVMAIAGCTAPQKKNEPQTIPPHQIHWINDAEVLNEIEAQEIAREALNYKSDQTVGESAVFYSGPCFEIDFDIPQFCRKGDRIWPVYKADAGSRENICAILVNAETANTTFLILNNVKSRLVACEIRKDASANKQITVPVKK